MALAAATVWEVRTTGSDSNGGGFVAGASGTDYSQQNAAQYTFTDLASSNGTNATPQVTSASHNFVAADVGNILQITAVGTNFTLGFYQIVSAAANAATLDKACGSAASCSGGTYAVGGALLTPAKAVNTAMVGQNTVWIQKGTYTQTAALIPPAGASGAPSRILGYNAARGDLDAVNNFANFPVLQNNNTTANIITLNNSYQRVRNLILDGGSGASKSSRCLLLNANYQIAENCKAINWTAEAFLMANTGNRCFRCWATGGIAGSVAGFFTESSGSVCDSCYASANPCAGFQCGGNASVFTRCISSGNTGASSDGFISSSSFGATYINCVAYNNGRDGIRFDGANSADTGAVYNCILANNAGYGMDSATTTWSDLPVNFNAFFSNTSGARNGVPTGANDVTLSGSPFTNAGSGDFSLNNTAGAGAACRAAGYPGVFPAGLTTGYLDIGAAQHQDLTSSTHASGFVG